MKAPRGSVATIVLGVSFLLSGCGGITMTRPGAGLGVSLGTRSVTTRLAPGSCLIPGAGFVTHGLNAAAMAGERRRQIHQLQSRFSLASSDVRAVQAGWRSIAEYGC